MPDDQTEQGRLTISAGGEPVPIEVRDATFKLIHEGMSGETVRLDPGIYQVQAQLPDGTGAKELVVIDPNDTSALDLGIQEFAATSPPSVGSDAEISDAVGGVIGHVFRGVLGSSSRPTKPTGKRSARRELRRRARPPAAPRSAGVTPSWSIRLGRFVDSGFTWDEGSSSPPTVEETSDSVQIRIDVPDNVIPLAQIVRRDQLPVNILLPSSSAAMSYSSLIARREHGQYTFAAFPPDSRVGLAARFLATGETDAGVRLFGAGEAEQMLEEKMADPMGAVVGAYLLLRASDVDRVHDWTRTLADRFPWLPDGAIVDGQRLMILNERGKAVTRFIDASTRGLPLFTEGYSVLLSRLRQFVTGELGECEDLPNAKRALAKLSRWSPFVDLSAPTLTFTGSEPSDPGASQNLGPRKTPGYRFARVDGALVLRS
jgi:hypothetical protein